MDGTGVGHSLLSHGSMLLRLYCFDLYVVDFRTAGPWQEGIHGYGPAILQGTTNRVD